ncbi:MAG: DUF4136 domain-containing protein [Gemmatimonadota bacterium]|nr:MAG: DUF4136 domain-containing protein [Gemmatimonadota bacterium]
MNNTPRKTVRKTVLVGAALSLGIGAAACYPGSIENIQELDVVVTVQDTSVDYSQFLLYAMPDTIVQINDTAEGSVELGRDHDALILSTIAQRMAQLGYVRVTIPEPPQVLPPDSTPDLVVLVTSVGVENSYYAWYPGWGYWGWWPGWGYWPGYGPGYGWGYPGYWVQGSYQAGTLFMDMLDPNAPAQPVEPPEIPVVWTGALNGVLGGSSAGTATRLTDGINRAFDQSPYLGRN